MAFTYKKNTCVNILYVTFAATVLTLAFRTENKTKKLTPSSILSFPIAGKMARRRK